MLHYLPESDWRLFREVSRVALDRFCARVLAEVAAASTATERSNHDRYLEVAEILEARDRELAAAFDDPRRSRMIEQLARQVALGLVTGDELARFTPATRDAVAGTTRPGAPR